MEYTANGHVAAMKKLPELKSNVEAYNLGRGQGYSVLQVLKGFEKALGYPVKMEMAARRPGDVSQLMANAQKANKQLDWKATRDLFDMCRDSVKFILKRKQAMQDK